MTTNNFEKYLAPQIKELINFEVFFKHDGIEMTIEKVNAILGKNNRYKASLANINAWFKTYQGNSRELYLLLQNAENAEQSFGDIDYEKTSNISKSLTNCQKLWLKLHKASKRIKKRTEDQIVEDERAAEQTRQYINTVKIDSETVKRLKKFEKSKLEKDISVIENSIGSLIDNTAEILINLREIDKNLFNDEYTELN